MDIFVNKFIKQASILKNKLNSDAELNTWDRVILLNLIDIALDKLINDYMQGK